MNIQNEQLLLNVKEIISKITRIPIEELKDHANLIELGLDSIVLIDVNAAIRGEFNVEIQPGQYFEKLTTVAAITEYIAENISESYFIPSVTSNDDSSIQKTTIPVKAETCVNELAANSPLLMRQYTSTEPEVLTLFSQQIHIINEQLRILSGNPNMQNTYAEIKANKPVDQMTSKYQEKNVKNESGQNSSDVNTRIEKPYVAHKKLDLNKRALDEAQQTCLNNLIAKYTQKTASSKAYIAKNRFHYADVRNISGFRPNIKELVYQLIFDRCEGAYITDIDGNTYIDLAMDFGVSLFGHNQDFITQAIGKELKKGYPLSFISSLSGEVAQLVCELTGADRVSFFNSGTEANMVAIRLSRAVTGKNKIVVFSGSYHGTSDGVLGMAKWGDEQRKAHPMAHGIPQSSVEDLIVLDYDDPKSLEFIKENASEIAAVLIEPVQSRRPDLQPRQFLQELRKLTEEKNIIYIFDEMICGFRLGANGAQEFYGIKADLVTYGKICGGGMPIGIVAGKQEVMNSIDGGDWNYGDDSVPPTEEKRTFVAGTFCHHPISMAAAKAVLTKIKDEKNHIYADVNQKTKYLCDSLNTYFINNKVPIQMVYCGSLFRFVLKGNLELFYYFLILKGVYVWEGRNSFISMSHTYEDLNKVIDVIKETCEEMQSFFPVAEPVGNKTTPLAKEQTEMVMLEVANPGTNALRESLLVEINGELDEAYIREAYELVVTRHESLRYTLSADFSEFIVNEPAKSDIAIVECYEDLNKKVAEICNSAFDFCKEPPFKITLIKMLNNTPNKWYMLITAHHVIADGWSLSVIFQELIEAYNSLKTGKKPEFLEPMSFAEYCSFIANKKDNLDKQQKQEFFDKYFRHLKHNHKVILPMKNDELLPDKKDGTRLTIIKERDFINKVRNLSVQLECSPFMFLFTAYQMMIREITNQESFIVGVPIAGQQRIMSKSIIGNCVSVRPVISEISSCCSIKEIIETNKRLFTDFEEMYDTRPEELVDDFSFPPLQVNVLFNMDRIPSSLNFHQTLVKLLPVKITDVVYDLFFNLIEINQQLIIDVDYNCNKFDETMVQRWLELYFTIIDELQRAIDITCGEMNVLTKDDEILVDQIIDVKLLESQLEIDLKNYGITENKLYCSIRNSENRPVIQYSYGYLYLGISKMECYNTGWIACITHESKLKLLAPNQYIVNKNGNLINLWQVEKRLLEKHDVIFAKVIFDQTKSEIIAFLDFLEEKLSVNEVSAWLNETLPRFMIPDKFYYSKNHNTECRGEEYLLHVERHNMTKTEQDIFDIVAHLIDSYNFQVNDNLFNLGLNSLQLIKMLAEIQDMYGIRVPISKLIGSVSVKNIAAIINEIKQDDTHKIIPLKKVAEQQFYEAASVQKRMYILNKLHTEGLNYNVSSILRLRGIFDKERFQRAIQQCIDKHNILKASFSEIEGEIVYSIQEDRTIDIEYTANETCYQNVDDLIKTESKKFIKPFDLTSGPLLRFKVIKYTEDYHVALIDLHHIVFDGSSAFIFAADLKQAYEEGQLLPLTYSYHDFVSWQHNLFETEYYNEQKKFWQNLFEDEPKIINIETDYSRPVNRSWKSATVDRMIDQKVNPKIERFCRSNNCTPFSFFVAAINILIASYTRECDITIGSVFEGRNHPDLAGMIGMFVNTLPLRNYIDHNQTISEFVAIVQNSNTNIFENSDVQFDTIVELSGVKRQENRNPLFDIVINYDDFGAQGFQLENLEVKFEEVISDTVRFDIEIRLAHIGNLFELHVLYAQELYKEDTINRLIDSFEIILQQMVEHSNRKIKDIKIISNLDARLITEEFNNTSREYPKEKTVVELFEEQAAKSPDKIAVECEGRQLTYRELNSRANRLARKLRSLGVKPDEYVGIIAERSLDMVVGIHAIVKSGGAYVPIDLANPRSRTEYILSDCNPTIILTAGATIEFAGQVPTLDLLDEQNYRGSAENVEAVNKPDDLIYLMYTSGTTGEPKGIMIEHRNVVRLVKNTTYTELNEQSVILQTGAMAFDASTFELWGTALNGGRLCLVNSAALITPNLLKAAIKKHQGNTMFITTALFNQLISFDKDIFNGLSYLLFGGEQTSEKHVKMMLESGSQVKLSNIYGPTECTTFAIHYPIEKGKARKKTPIGKPIANTTAYIVNGATLCGIGMPGELCLSGDGVARGYLNKPELTAEKFIENPYGPGKLYRTGDLARWLPDGNIEFLGRIDDQVKIRGFRIELGEVESALRKLAGIDDVAIVAREEATGDKAICAYVVSKQEINVSEIRTVLKKELPEYMIPAYMMQLEKIPVNTNGKLDKKALPKIEAKSEALYAAPGNELEEQLVQAFEQVLGVGRVGINDSFFELGGHSLRATRLMNQIEAMTGKRLPLKEIFARPTVKELSELMRTKEEASYQPIEKVAAREYYPMSSAQKRLYIIDQIDDSKVAYNMPFFLELEGQVDAEKIDRAIKSLVQRHESLRTSFHVIHGEYVQRISEEVKVELEITKVSELTEEENRRIIGKFIRPFELDKGPLLRVGLVSASQGKSMMMFDMHHIIFDGMSANIMMKDFSALYNGGKLEELTIQYKDYSEWMSKRDIAKQKEYWLKEFSGEIPVIDLPTDSPRPQIQSYRGSNIAGKIEEEVKAKIVELCKASGATEYMVLLAAFMVLLSKYSNQESVVVGTPISGRTHRDTESIIGMFVNTLAIKGEVVAEKSFGELLGEIKDRCLKAYETQEYPFEELVENLEIVRDLARNPLFDVMFVLQNNEQTEITMDGVKVTERTNPNTVAKFDLTLSLSHEETGYGVDFEYCVDLFKAETIRRLQKHFGKILEEIVSNPAQKISEISVLDEAEKQVILEEFNNTSREYPKEKTVVELFEEQAAKSPDQIAVECEGRQLTYRELNNRANQLARKLRSLGVKPDEYVGIITERSLDMMVGIYATMKAGGAYVPIDPNYPVSRIEYILKDSRPKAILAGRLTLPLEPEAVVLRLADETNYIGSADNLPLTNQSSDLIYVLYTSGTTGVPKGVMIEHKSVNNLITAITGPIGYKQGKKILSIITMSFDMFVNETLVPLTKGVTVYIANEEEQRDPYKACQLIRANSINMLQMTPSQIKAYVYPKNLLSELTSVTDILVGGEAFPSAILDHVGQSRNLNIYNMYGPTEITVYASIKQVAGNEKVTIGKPIANVKIYIVDKTNKIQPIGIPGEVYIAGEGLARGYLNKEDLTAEKFISNPFGEGRVYKTGDLGRWMSDGNIEYLGRMDDQVKIRGYRIELGEIESALRNIEGIENVAVIVNEESSGDKAISGYLVSRNEVNIGDVKTALRKELPEYMVPGHLMQIERIPVTDNGKLDKKALPKIEVKEQQEYIGPRNEQEEKLVEIVKDVLGISVLGVRDNFFELGGDSIKAIRVISKLRETGYELSVIELMQGRTIEAISEKVRVSDDHAYEQNQVIGKGRFRPMQYEGSNEELAEQGVNTDDFSDLIRLIDDQIASYTNTIMSQSIVAELPLSPIQKLSYDLGIRSTFLQIDFDEIVDRKKLEIIWSMLINKYGVLKSSIAINESAKTMVEYDCNSYLEIPYVNIAHYKDSIKMQALHQIINHMNFYKDSNLYQGKNLASYVVLVKVFADQYRELRKFCVKVNKKASLWTRILV